MPNYTENHELILGKLDDIHEIAKANQRTLRGHNSTPGLVGKVDVLQRDMAQHSKDHDTKEEDEKSKKQWTNRFIVSTAVLVGLDIILHVSGLI